MLRRVNNRREIPGDGGEEMGGGAPSSRCGRLGGIRDLDLDQENSASHPLAGLPAMAAGADRRGAAFVSRLTDAKVPLGFRFDDRTLARMESRELGPRWFSIAASGESDRLDERDPRSEASESVAAESLRNR